MNWKMLERRGHRMKPRTIVIAEQQTLLREGMRKIIDLEPDLKVVAAAENGDGLCSAAASHRPAAVIIDSGLPSMSCVELTSWFKARMPETKVILFATDMNEEELLQSLAAGANGILLRDIEWDELLEQIRAVLRGHLVLPERLAAKLAHKLYRILTGETYGKRRHSALLEKFRLTEKEYEISMLMAKGLSNRQIAETLMYSDGTVRNYVSSVYEKIGVRDRAKAVIFLRDTGLQRPADPVYAQLQT